MSNAVNLQPLQRWSRVNAISCGTNAIVSDVSSSVTGYGSSFYFFWVRQDDKQLTYCVLDRQTLDDTWSSTGESIPVVCIGRQTPETALEPPSLALHQGRIHAMFRDEDQDVIHIQLDPASRIWNQRTPRGNFPFGPPVIASFQGRIFCAYKTDSNGTVVISTWDGNAGWSYLPISPGSATSLSKIALFQHGESLHLYLISTVQTTATSSDTTTPSSTTATTSRIIVHYAYGLNATWMPQDALAQSTILEGSGISGSSVTSIGFLAIIGSTGGDNGEPMVTIKQFENPTPGRAPPVPVPDDGFTIASIENPEAPDMAIVGNTLICVWRNANNSFSYRTRHVYDIPPLAKWMSAIAQQDIPISRLTIPGTHDSAAVNELVGIGTQNFSIAKQLREGIRYLDIRARAVNVSQDISLVNPLIACHSSFPIYKSEGILKQIVHFMGASTTLELPDYLQLKDIFDQCYAFLDHEGKDECIFMQIKQDFPTPPNQFQKSISPRTTAYEDAREMEVGFALAVMALIKKKKDKWRLDNTLPRLSDVRGRIQLVRRFEDTEALHKCGINVYENWPNNSSGSIRPRTRHPHGPLIPLTYSIQIQDQWDFGANPNVCAEKMALVENMLLEAKEHPYEETRSVRTPERWFVNFASATAGNLLYGGARVAIGGVGPVTMQLATGGSGYDEGVNARLERWFRGRGKGCFGTVLMDCAEVPQGLILGIVMTNEFRPSGGGDGAGTV